MREGLADAIVVVRGFRLPALASRFRQWWVKVSNPKADISFGEDCYVGRGFSIHAPWGGTFRVGQSCEFRRGFRADLMGPDSRITIGTGSRFTYYTTIQCGTTIDIGRRAVFANGALVVDGSHRFRDLDVPAVDQGYDFRAIEVGDDAMVMAKATVIASLGERAFVGAGAVVTEPVPPFTVAVGVPARPIEYFGPEPTGG